MLLNFISIKINIVNGILEKPFFRDTQFIQDPR